MRTFFLKGIFTAAGVFGFMAGAAVAAPQAATNNSQGLVPRSDATAPLVPRSASATPMVAASTPQPYAPIGGAFTPALMGRSPWDDYFSRTNRVGLGGSLGLAPLGGIWYAGPVGGTMNGPIGPGGRLTNVFVGGALSPAFPPGGVLTGRPPGGQFGTNILGGIRSPNYSFTNGPSGVIVGGAQPAGASPGGIIVGGAPPGGVIVKGSSPGGVLVGSPPPITNAPGGHLQ
ncbi:MAG: hypothetical protein ABSG04_02410 [Verrucomicrobiota bacterium]